MQGKMKFKQNQQGYTLIEMMVAVVVLGVILAIAVPSFNAMIKNTQIRTAAESVSNGLLKARAEAISRNTNVTFVLGAGTSWSIRQVSGNVLIESRASKEGSADVTLTAVDAAVAAATTVTFNSLGGIVATNADASLPIAQVDFTTTGGDRDLRVEIGAGGRIKMCDPNLTSGSSPRAC